MLTGSAVAPAGNLRRTPQARVTKQPWGVTRKLHDRVGIRSDNRRAVAGSGSPGKLQKTGGHKHSAHHGQGNKAETCVSCPLLLPARTCPSLSSGTVWAFRRSQASLGRTGKLLGDLWYLRPGLSVG